MRRMEASRRNASALSVRFSKSLARRRPRLSQARVRSTTHRIGSISNPLALSDRFTISTASFGRCLATAWANCGIGKQLEQERGCPAYWVEVLEPRPQLHVHLIIAARVRRLRSMIDSLHASALFDERVKAKRVYDMTGLARYLSKFATSQAHYVTGFAFRRAGPAADPGSRSIRIGERDPGGRRR